MAGAFILASLVKVLNVKEVQPTYRLSLLTALAFLIVAPLPLVAHLSHPERSLEMFLTPSTSSAMAMFGFVYIWYLMAVLLLEIWFDHRKELILRADKGKRFKTPLSSISFLFIQRTSHHTRWLSTKKLSTPLPLSAYLQPFSSTDMWDSYSVL